MIIDVFYLIQLCVLLLIRFFFVLFFFLHSFVTKRLDGMFVCVHVIQWNDMNVAGKIVRILRFSSFLLSLALLFLSKLHILNKKTTDGQTEVEKHMFIQHIRYIVLKWIRCSCWLENFSHALISISIFITILWNNVDVIEVHVLNNNTNNKCNMQICVVIFIFFSFLFSLSSITWKSHAIRHRVGHELNI